MSLAEELRWQGAVRTAALVRSGELKPEEAVRAAAERAAALNPSLNAVVHPMYDRAVDAAKAQPEGAPLAGTAMLVKDLMTEVGGAPLSCGSAFLADRHKPLQDSEVIRRWKSGGCAVLGKSATSEFGLLPSTEPALHGPTRNPWDAGLSPGGSSGGSAAAVAAGVVPVAHGNDGGGSNRIPASACGVFALKPTRARIPLGPRYGDFMSGLASEGVLSRSVEDTAAMLDLACGPQAGDPYSAPQRHGGFLEALRASPQRLRLAVCPSSSSMHEEVRAALVQTAALCAELGHQLEEAAPPVSSEVPAAVRTVRTVECAWQIDGWARRLGRQPAPGELEPLTAAVYEAGKAHSGSDYLSAWEELQRWSRAVAKFFETYDAVMVPTLAVLPAKLGEFSGTGDLKAMRRSRDYSPFTMMASVTGQPAMSVPLHWTPGGVPVGVHFTGRFGEDAVLLRLAAQLEEARPWAGRRPPL